MKEGTEDLRGNLKKEKMEFWEDGEVALSDPLASERGYMCFVEWLSVQYGKEFRKEVQRRFRHFLRK